MNWPALVERLARALGVWWPGIAAATEDDNWPAKSFVVHPAAANAPGKVAVTVGPRGQSEQFTHTISTGQALWLLLEVARGQRLDVGPCRACGGSKWESRNIPLPRPLKTALLEDEGWERVGEIKYEERGVFDRWIDVRRPCPECSEPGPEVDGWEWWVFEAVGRTLSDCVGPDNRRANHRQWAREGWTLGIIHEDGTRHIRYGKRPERVPGPPQPTGRRVLEPWVWVLDAITPQVHKGVGFGSDASVADAERCAQEHARSIGAVAHVIGSWQPTPSSWHVSCEIRWPGDPAVRAAAPWLARSTTSEGAMVLRDWREAYPDKGPDKCSLPADSAWGLVIAAGLLGECQGCDGGWVHEWTQATDQGWNPVAPGLPEPVLPWTGVVRERWSAREGRACRKVECPDCRGLGAVLGSSSIAAERLAVAECEAREDSPPSTPTQDRPEPDDMHGAADGFGGQDIYGWE